MKDSVTMYLQVLSRLFEAAAQQQCNDAGRSVRHADVALLLQDDVLHSV